MEIIKIAAAQFENKSGDKKYNLEVIRKLSEKASKDGADVVSFHECSATGYTFARRLSKEEMLDLAEFIPEGDSVKELTRIAGDFNIVVLAGLFEKDKEDNLYNAYICVNEKGVIAKHRKFHPFINPQIKPGEQYAVFDLNGWKCGILICYDNNIIENVRAAALLGAEIIFAPHVTMCAPSTYPGSGFVDHKLWENRLNNPDALRAEFDGAKGRKWLMKWLPARAYDNGVYIVFTNSIGMDDDHLKNGCSMILDPFGDILAECRTLGDDVVSAVCEKEKLEKAGGYRYRNARRPELYTDILSRSHNSKQIVAWIDVKH